ncbi:MAG: PAS domain S-box protein [bacterium]
MDKGNARDKDDVSYKFEEQMLAVRKLASILKDCPDDLKRQAASEIEALLDILDLPVSKDKHPTTSSSLSEDSHQLPTERQLDAIVDSMIDGIIITDLNGKTITTNNIALSAYPHSETVFKTLDLREAEEFYEMRDPDGELVPFDDGLLTRVLRGERHHRYLARIIHKATGEWREVRFTGNLARDKSGNPICAVLTVQDRTPLTEVREERRAAREQLQRQAAEMEAILHSIPTGVFIHDADGTIQMLNPYAQQLMGYTDKDMMLPLQERVKSREFRAVDGQPMDMEMPPTARALRGETVEAVVVGIPDKDGKVTWVSTSAAPIKDEKGEIQKVVTAFTDITSIRETERQLEEANSTFSAVFNAMAEGIVISDLDGNVLMRNPSSLSIYPHREEYEQARHVNYIAEFYEMRDIDNNVLPTEGRPLQRILRGEILESFEAQVVHKASGEKCDVIFSGTLVRDKAGAPICALLTMNDVTTEKEANLMLEEAYLRAEIQAAELEALFETMPANIILYDINMNVLKANNSALNTFIMLHGGSNFHVSERQRLPIRPSGVPYADSELPTARALRGERVNGEVYYIDTLSGERIWLSVSTVPIYDADGTLAGAVHTSLDITNERENQAQLNLLYNRVTGIVDCISDGLIIADANGLIEMINPPAMRMHGITLEEVHQENIGYPDTYQFQHLDGTLILPEERPLDRALRGETFTAYEVGLLHTDTNVFWIGSYSSGILRDAEGKVLTVILIIRDVTEQKKSQEALKYALENLSINQERLRVAFLRFPITAFNLDKDLKYTWVYNPKIYFPTTDIIGKTTMELMAPHGENLTAFMKQAISEDEGAEGLLSYELNGEMKYFQSILEPLHNENGIVIGLTGAVLDVTGMRKAEREMEQAQEQGHLGNFSYNLRTKQLTWSKEMFHIHGLDHVGNKIPTRAQIIQMVHPDDRKSFSAAYEQAMVNGIGFNIETRLIMADGSEKHIRAETDIEHDTQGHLSRVFGTVLDITASKQAELSLANAIRDLQASEERLATTLRSIGEGVIATDTDGKIILINQVAQLLLCVSQDEAIGKLASDIYSTTDEKTRKPRKDGFKAALNSLNYNVIRHSWLTGHDGIEHLISERTTPITDQDHHITGAVCIFNDITQQHRLEQEIANISKLESLGLLAGGLAHDLNNILAVIMGSVSLVSMMPYIAEQERGLLEAAENATERARDLTRQLLTFSKGGAPVKQVTSMEQLLHEAVLFVLHGSKTNCEFSFDEDLWPVEADHGQISQVIENLVINASQAMSAGGTIFLQARNVVIDSVSTLPLQAGNYVSVEIIDQGNGIPPEILDRLFDPFFTTKATGTGLGLTTVHSIIRRHNGHIEVRSELGKGTTFTFYLPSTTKAAAEKAILEKTSTKPIFKGRILVMDDEEILRYLAEASLKHLGCTVSLSKNGAEAVALFEEAITQGQPFDGVLLDLTISGGLGGKETIEKLKEIEPNIKAIVFSGYANDPIMANYRDYGFIAAIAKPFRIDDLVRALTILFDK